LDTIVGLEGLLIGRFLMSVNPLQAGSRKSGIQKGWQNNLR